MQVFEDEAPGRTQSQANHAVTCVTLEINKMHVSCYRAYLSLIAKSERNASSLPLFLFSLLLKQQMVVIRESDSQNRNIHIPILSLHLPVTIFYLYLICVHL